jgi:predicted tellurium resistance membrane protein TerC
LAGAFPAPPLGIAWIIAACTILAYVIGGQLRADRWQHRIVHVLSATLAVASMATVLVSALVWMMAAVITPGASHVAVVRTLAACSLALALASLGPRWQRVELVWLAYATLALVTAKLLFEDLRQGHPEFIAASIFLYAVTLILVPRLARRASRPSPPPSPEI